MLKKKNRRLRLRLPTLRQVLDLLKDVAVRLYSLALLALLCWIGWQAGSYLRNSVFRPTRIPPNLLSWQGRLDVAALRQQNVAGVTGAAGRAPLGHYHSVDRWFQPDTTNTCTTAGCHQPLPHSQKMRVPAFANFHTTFLACQMCHTDIHRANGQPARVVWLGTATGRVQDMPPILALLRYLDAKRDQVSSDPAAADANIRALLRRVIAEAGEDGELDTLLAQMENAAPGGPVWRQAVQQLAAELPLHARGEYAAKITPAGAGDPSTASAKSMALLTSQYLAASNEDRRKQIKDQLHAPLLKEAASCIACHGDQPALLDFEALGYAPQRAAVLHSLPLARMMQRIRQGEQFYIPSILEAK